MNYFPPENDVRESRFNLEIIYFSTIKNKGVAES